MTTNDSNKQLAQNIAEAELRNRIVVLNKQLQEAQDALTRMSSNDDGNNAGNREKIPPDYSKSTNDHHPLLSLPLGKRGYLFKWQDRSIGWGGTKWGLRFVCLEGGKLSYFRSHTDDSPRYVLTLRGCAVRDDGFKLNRRHTSKQGKGVTPPLDEIGAYFHVFSIYQLEVGVDGTTTSTADDTDIIGASDDIIPLLRFSTPSLAEKNQWVRLIAESCAYCDSDEFLKHEADKAAELERQKQQQMTMADTIPALKRNKDTLPALYFAPPEPPPLMRVPSGTKLRAPKHYRSKSGDANAAKSNPRSKSGYPPSRPMHRKAAPSYLSEEATAQNYRGLFNLAMIILVVSNFRLILGTMRRHGFVLYNIQVPKILSLFSQGSWRETPLIAEFMFLQLFLWMAFALEWLLSRNKLGDKFGTFLHFCNAHGCLLSMSYIVWNYIESPAIGGIVLIHATITWMKLISYIHANSDYRRNPETSTHRATMALIDNLDPDEMSVSYPNNVTLANMYYFWFAPSLTYQIAFPRAPEVRPWRIAGILFRLFFAIALYLFLAAQVVSPNLNSLVRDLESTNGHYTVPIMAEYWLKLAVVNTYLWLLMFYVYFHLYLNLFAEILRFGDRVFYKDWWNSGELSAYWRLWNMPVHYWLVRHVYFPCIRIGLSRSMSTFTVFFLSAIMHEFLISIPFHMVRPWSFLGMMAQIPLVGLTKYLYRRLPGSSVGNIIFWMSFCVVGQPMAILLYTADYQYGKQVGMMDDAVSAPQQCSNAFWRKSC